jgi:hypothetical protein
MSRPCAILALGIVVGAGALLSMHSGIEATLGWDQKVALFAVGALLALVIPRLSALLPARVSVRREPPRS